MNFEDLWVLFSEWIILAGRKALQIGLILLITFIGLRLRKVGIKKIFDITKWSEKKEQTLATLLMSLSRYVIITIGVLMILDELGAQIGPILAGAGIVGLAVGFGAQDLVKDFIKGFFIMFEDQFHVGDFVEVNGAIVGTVEELGLRMTKIREWEGHVDYISNSSIERVKNYNREKMRCLISVIVPYEEDHEKVRKVIKRLCENLAETHREYFIQDKEGNLVEPPQLYGIIDIEQNQAGVKYTITGLVKDTSYFYMCAEMRRIVLDEFNQNNIKISYPRRIFENVAPKTEE